MTAPVTTRQATRHAAAGVPAPAAAVPVQPPRLYHGAPPAKPPWASAAEELRDTLGGSPPTVSPKFFYDAAGCALYEQICEQPAYYPPRVEQAILDRHQAHILAALPRDLELVDIGSGDGAKARRWLQAGIVGRYIGLDIAEPWLRDCLARGARDFPAVQFDGVVADLTWGFQLPALRERGRPRLLCYPGSSIGNFDPAEAQRLLQQMRQQLRPGDHLLLGADGPTDPARMERAYDDPAGITAAFNLNVLQVVNRTLGTTLDAADFRHRALFNPGPSRIEMHLVARRALQADLGAGRRLQLVEGDSIVTEHSWKHRPTHMQALLQAAGFDRVQRFGIPDEGFGVFLCGVGDGH
ncbi:L-histidine N(alpha)-methyltransferase [Aquabacterium sp. OR-4]|uniref:L-histidine N(alpha)-methyltransferase n=1 Tax=Aquabacterium sp. OR-4 TaxID=2978127 RepID=UPI0028C753C3|nr:L-histidine N(alpha)-methyltransferase [Aquabacterium sp. OR-4]MDT7838572.1 L-histidine N(alpha)-methyltransferase [Aquabacterium sp. OR-4]